MEKTALMQIKCKLSQGSWDNLVFNTRKQQW